MTRTAGQASGRYRWDGGGGNVGELDSLEPWCRSLSSGGQSAPTTPPITAPITGPTKGAAPTASKETSSRHCPRHGPSGASCLLGPLFEIIVHGPPHCFVVSLTDPDGVGQKQVAFLSVCTFVPITLKMPSSAARGEPLVLSSRATLVMSRRRCEASRSSWTSSLHDEREASHLRRDMTRVARRLVQVARLGSVLRHLECDRHK